MLSLNDVLEGLFQGCIFRSDLETLFVRGHRLLDLVELVKSETLSRIALLMNAISVKGEAPQRHEIVV